MQNLRAPVDGQVLFCRELSRQKTPFLIPFPAFFQNHDHLCHLLLRLDDSLLRTPVDGILLHADSMRMRFFVSGKQAVALWLHGENSPSFLQVDSSFLPLADEGAPLRRGQLLGRSLYRRGQVPLLALLTPIPDGHRAVCHTGQRSGGRSPLLTFERL